MVSGLPGVGKSAVADAVGQHLGAVVLSVDPIEAAIWRAGIEPSFETGVAAYEVAATLAEHQLALGLTVIVDAVSSIEVARNMWRRAAARAAAPARIVEVVCVDVDLHRRRLASRQRMIDGFPEPTWEQVEARRAEWEPWSEDRLVVDSTGALDDNVAEVLAYLAR